MTVVAIVILLVSVLRFGLAQDYYEDRHKYEFRTQTGHLNEVPNKFEVKGSDAIPEFHKYLTEIQELARRDNLTIIYKVKVEAIDSNKKKVTKKLLKKSKVKKYNIPLKKKNMKLSNFEIILRKRINEISHKQINSADHTTTEKQRIVMTTKTPTMGKYKPIVSHVKTNYTKKRTVRPVRNKIITLTR
ncbi:unnamed protein product [Leptidea sinapis]|uniref:Uncharacterized protein n=1 Tax=Leptidea sinapis TaxID=189913 RepID=A0A5E4QQ38_9NEOP|nr:unnamed protein product [Leptidea sinapis]